MAVSAIAGGDGVFYRMRGRTVDLLCWACLVVADMQSYENDVLQKLIGAVPLDRNVTVLRFAWRRSSRSPRCRGTGA